MTVTLHLGDCRDIMARMPDNSVDAIVTDPPYGLTNRVPDVKKCAQCGRVLGGTDGKPEVCPKCGGELYNQRSQGQGFMGKDWDGSGIEYSVDMWQQALRVLKPGGHLLAFGGSRTYHRLAVAIEDAGFEIRDQLQYLYGSGFPKSLDVGKAIDKAAGAEREVTGRRGGRAAYGYNPQTQTIAPGGMFRWGDEHFSWEDLPPQARESLTRAAEAMTQSTAPATDLARQWDGWGTALKPAHEPIVLARKPLIGTVARNVEAWGTGGINVDATRIGYTEGGRPSDSCWSKNASSGEKSAEQVFAGGWQTSGKTIAEKEHPQGRWPANVILGCCGNDPHDPDCAAALLDAQSGTLTSSNWSGHRNQPKTRNTFGSFSLQDEKPRPGDMGGASRFFYCSKASRRERNAGLEGMPEREHRSYEGGAIVSADHPDTSPGGHTKPTANSHPTVKPISLMRWLVRLITPPGGIVLDPFMGSGSTGCAAVLEGMDFIGCDLDTEYVEIACRRIAYYEAQIANAGPQQASFMEEA